MVELAGHLMFRFTIRDVLWLMVVVGLGAGWWADRSSVASERDSITSLYRALGSAVIQQGWMPTLNSDRTFSLMPPTAPAQTIQSPLKSDTTRDVPE
jgi:hypothetical protein